MINSTIEFTQSIRLAKQVSFQAAELVSKIEHHKLLVGTYPAALDPSEFTISEPLKSHLGSYYTSADDFFLFYYVLRRSIGHFYSSTSGWGHGDD